LILASTIALVGIGVMLSIFYGQHQWLTSGIVATSVQQHEASLAASFERRARGQLYRIANSISESEFVEAAATRSILNQAIAANEALVGLQYTHSNGSIELVGIVAEEETPCGVVIVFI
jgi:hypothetical protein